MERAGRTRIVASSDAAEFIRGHGGRLWVWPHFHRCCSGAMTLLDSSTAPPTDVSTFRALDAGSFQVYLDQRLRRDPDELVLELHGWRRKRVDAFWNGCAWVEPD